MGNNRIQDNAQWYMNELASRVVAESGKPDDRFHLGKLILRSFKDYPEHILQIDGITGESVTNKKIMERSIKCANCFRNMGLNVGDVIVIMSASNLDISVPFYAALFTGLIVSPVDRTLGILEMVNTFELVQPKAIFCQSNKASDIQIALNKVDLDSLIITFDKGDYLCDLDDFFDQNADDLPVEDFQITDLDPNETTAILIFTSGTTGLPKAAEATHKNYAISIPTLWCTHTDFPSPVQMTLLGAPLQWLTSLYQYVSTPIFAVTRLECSSNLTPEIACHLINTYRPPFTVLSPTFITSLMKIQDQCDLSCFKDIYLGGSAVPAELIESIKEQSPGTEVYIAYGMTELSGLGFHAYTSAQGARIMRLGCCQYRLINNETNEEILEPNVHGELWLKGPTIIKGYYKNVAATEETFAGDRWFKTGDMFYRDEFWNFYFVERIKLLLKYKSYQISPVEVENVIRGHPGVLDVAVTSIPDDECGDLPVACVVRRPGYDNIAEEIKTLVKESLSDAKQLRGGVLFVDAIPMTANTKVHRQKLKDLTKTMEIY